MAFGIPFLPSLDTLLSLPFLGFLVLPSVSSNLSWGTSLNFVFFYLTWATVVWSHDPLYIELFGALAVRVVFYILPCTMFLLLDLLLPTVSTSIKAHGDRGLPQLATRSRDFSILARYVGVCVFNVLLGVALQSLLRYGLTDVASASPALKISTTIPLPLTIAKDVTRAYLVRGPLSYYIHRRLLHSSRFTPILARWHRTWHHRLTTTLPFSASYDHPVVYVLHSWLPVYLPAAVFKMHLLTYFVFLGLISLEEALAHSGYNVLPSTILLAGMARRNEAHMMARAGEAGNFGPWGFMDWAHGTSLAGRDVMDDLEDEAEKRDLRGKTRKLTSRTSKATRELVRGGADEDEDVEEVDDARLDGTDSAASSRKSKASRLLRRKK